MDEPVGTPTSGTASSVLRPIIARRTSIAPFSNGIALEQALVTSIIEEGAGIAAGKFVAIGGGAASDLWCAIFTGVCGKPVQRSQTVEASSLGADMVKGREVRQAGPSARAEER